MTTGTRITWPDLKQREMAEHPEVYAAYAAFLHMVAAGWRWRPDNPEPDRPFIVIERLDQIPIFASEEEEHEYWAVHDFSDDLWESLPPVPDDQLPPVRRTGR